MQEHRQHHRKAETFHLHSDNHQHHKHANYNAIISEEEEARPQRRRKSTVRSNLQTRWHATEDLWPPPRQVRMGNIDDVYNPEKDMTWSELFFDLIFVVTIARLGEHARQPSVSGISFEDGSYFIYFWLFYLFWLQANIYGTRFAHNDAPTMLYYATTMLGTVGMTMHLYGGLDGEAFPRFASSAALTTLADTLAYLRIWLTPNPTGADAEVHVSPNGRNFAKAGLFHNLLRLLPLLATGAGLIENKYAVIKWCIATFYTPFFYMIFLPCTLASPPKNQNEEFAELTEEEKKENEEKKKRQAKNAAKEELDKKVTSLKKNVEQIQHLMSERLENPDFYKYVPGRAPAVPDGFETHETEADDEFEESLEQVELFTIHVDSWVKKHKSKLYNEEMSAWKDPLGNTFDNKCWNRSWCHIPGHPKVFVPIHLEHFTERLGLFVIIGLGEVVDDITSKDTEEFCSDMYTVVIASFMILFALKTLYFDSDSSDADDHAMRRHRFTGMAWMWMHMPAMAGVAWLGSGLNLMTTISRKCGNFDEDIEEADLTSVENRRYYVCWSLSVFLLTLVFLFTLHQHPDNSEHPHRYLKICAQCIFALIMLVVPIFFPEEVIPDSTLLVFIAIGLISLVAFSFVEARLSFLVK